MFDLFDGDFLENTFEDTNQMKHGHKLMYIRKKAEASGGSQDFIYRLQDDEMWYKFFLTIIPKSKYKKINYLKKFKKDKIKEPISPITNRRGIKCLNRKEPGISF